jgi:xanthine dehydrogenase accessory factor
MKPDIRDALLAARAAARPVALATNLRSGQQRLIYATESEGDLCLDVDMVAAAAEALKADRPTTLSTPAGQVFIQVFNPPPRMIVVGAVHIAEPLAKMGELAGYGVTVVDPRRAFAAGQKFEGFTVLGDWPDEAMERLKPDTRTAVVTLTHDPKLDDPALAAALKSPAFYIGALGSRKTHASRLGRLKDAGFDDRALARIHGPVGIDINALSPAEIAISIMAQITAVRRQDAA